MVCKNRLLIFRAEKTYEKTVRFVGDRIFSLYDTNEIVGIE